MLSMSCSSCHRGVDIVAVLVATLLASLLTSAYAQANMPTSTTTSTTTTDSSVERTYFDTFLAFPPEYVALLGLGVLFIILFFIVVIIICVTAKPHYKY